MNDEEVCVQISRNIIADNYRAVRLQIDSIKSALDTLYKLVKSNNRKNTSEKKKLIELEKGLEDLEYDIRIINILNEKKNELRIR